MGLCHFSAIASRARFPRFYEVTDTKDGRIEAVRIGKRQWRVRRDSPIQPIRREERAVSGRELAIERARQLAAKIAGGTR